MANEMETYVTIKNGDINVANKLKELFTPKEGEYNSRTIELINRLYGKDYTWDINLSKEENQEAENTWPEFEWLGNNVGSKWIYSEYDHDDDTEYIHLVITSPWAVPQGFLKKLSEVLRSPPANIQSVGLTPFAQAMSHFPECIVKDDAVKAYRNYYHVAKDFAVWKKTREAPYWWEGFKGRTLIEAIS